MTLREKVQYDSVGCGDVVNRDGDVKIIQEGRINSNIFSQYLMFVTPNWHVKSMEINL